MTPLQGSESAVFPWWSAVPVALMQAADVQGWRIRCFRLTEEEREQLRQCTQQDSTLYGYPVVSR